jgi:hypothetical protein
MMQKNLLTDIISSVYRNLHEFMCSYEAQNNEKLK